MTQKALDLVEYFINRKIGKEELLQKLSIELEFSLNENSCLQKLEAALNQHDSESIEVFLMVGFMIGFTSQASVIMCKLIISPDHNSHEDIANFLKELADPKTADCLYKAAELQFAYLDYDETYQFARKCIKALFAIGDENSINKIRMLTKSKIPEIAEHANHELSYLD